MTRLEGLSGNGASLSPTTREVAWRSLWLWPFRPKPRNFIAWVIVVCLACSYVSYGWKLEGWVSCDFGGPWLLGRMFARGEAAELYLRPAQKAALASGYRDRQLTTVTEEILGKSQDEWEGPLYPPTAGLLMWPFAILDPQACHAVLSVLFAQMLLVSAWMIHRLTGSWLRMGEAALFLFAFPNSCQTIILGQNAALTLTIVTAGLLLWRSGWPFAGGLVWGLLAYKPVFAVALVWVPLLFGSRRMFLGMVLGGMAYCAATLPFCGLDSWWRWFVVGRNNADLYARDENWIWLSRDLLGLSRRQMWDAEHVVAHLRYLVGLDAKNEKLLQAVQTGPIQTVIGWSLIGLIFAGTVLTALARRKSGGWRAESEAQTRERAAFVILGGMLTCYHFMYYDVLIFALPVALLTATWPERSRPGRVWLVLVAGGLVACQLDMEVWRQDGFRLPFETFLLLIGWLGSGLFALRAGGEHATPSCSHSTSVRAPA